MLCSTHEERVNDTVEFRHLSIHQPHPMPEDRLQHGMQKLTEALTDAPNPVGDGQLGALKKLCDAFCQ
ncbi:hypothetical protein ACHAWF_012954 [Thalassiosira exigua]